MKWFATKAEYWEGQWANGTMSAGREYGECIWSVSTDPNAPGWNTDGGTSGYGVPEDVARLMAAAPDLLAALKAAREKLQIACDGVREYDGGMATQFLFPMIDAAIARAVK